MNLFYRIGVGLMVWGAVACSKNETETAVPVAEPETVVIGCSGAAGADVDVRTQLDDDGLSVCWMSGDEIRLWARESGATEFLTGVQNVPFRFDYYSPLWSRAGFTGTISGVESTFDTTKKYDYFAVSPAPAEGAVNGTRVTYTIPAEQTGEFDGRYDIMTAEPLPDAAGLQAGDNNPSINLVFHHHIHLLRFTIPSNNLGEPVRAVELTFPTAVVGQLTVDATDPTVNELTALTDDADSGQKVMIEFPKGQERDVRDTFYAMIAPVSFERGGTIAMRIIGTTGETSVDLPIADKNERGDDKVNQTLRANGSTHIKLNVPAKNTFYTVLKFTVTDGAGGMGENTLGERLQVVRLKGGAGAFTDAVPSDEYRVVAADDGKTLECIVSDDSDGEYEVIFVSEKLSGSKCPWPVWDRSRAISGQTLEVEYESESAWIRSIPNYSTVQTNKAISFDSDNKCSIDLSIPYLFEEDFSKANGLDVNGTDNKKEQGGSKLDKKYFLYEGWTGNQVAGYLNDSASNRPNCIEIKTRVEATGLITGLYNGRLDSAPMKYLKGTSNLQVQFDYYYHCGSTLDVYTRKMNYGTTTEQKAINAYWYGIEGWQIGHGGDKVSDKSCPLEVEKGDKICDWIIPSATNATRLSWELEVTGKTDGDVDSHNHHLRLSNLRVSITK